MKNWKQIKRTVLEDGERINQLPRYNSNLPLEEKLHICNSKLPNIYEIIVRHNEEIYAFDTMGYILYGDETEYPLELLVNNII
jgi:hypothetical protein